MKVFTVFLILLSAARSFASFDDSKCGSELKEFDDALANRELWALKLFDTWGKIQSGILHGNRHNPGHFSDCVKLRHKEMRSQHCMVVTIPTENQTLQSNDGRFNWREVGALARDQDLSLVVGVCLPASCSAEKVLKYSSAILYEADMLTLSATCRTNDALPFEAIDIFAIIIFSLLAALVLASTAYEVVMIRRNRKPDELLSAFSAYTTGAKLFAYSENKSSNAINCLDGLRTMSIFWIILGHRFDDRDMVPVFNRDESASFRKNFLYLLYTNYDKPVETFFVIGGLLVTWSMLKALDNKTTNVPRMILHRWLRYTPSLAILMLFNVSLIKFSGSGPFFNPYTAACEKYWWSSLLHISVYTNPLEICYEVSWYLAVDFQLFIISPFLIYPLWKLKRKLYWILPTLVVLVQGCIFTTVYMNEISVYFFGMSTPEGFAVWLSKWYFPTHLRLGAWLVGIMLGFIMHQTRGRKVEVNKVVDAVLWVTSLSVILAIILCLYPFTQTDNQTSRFSNALYNSVFRVAWSYAVAWIIFSCHNGSGGIVRWFLSLKQWQPLGKMGLSIYLVHRMYQIVTNLNEKQPIYWDFFTQLQKFYGDLFVSIFLGTALFLAVENPVLKIENFLYKKIKSK